MILEDLHMQRIVGQIRRAILFCLRSASPTHKNTFVAQSNKKEKAARPPGLTAP